ncbi:MAG TPA: hypothetical protein ENJ28_08510 [Gammaproteobacteria bacterium]|nr:hypothetical protein [Gammaproteobacteria bacterium]
MKSSPLTQWPYFWAFKNYGLTLAHARVITIIYFTLFIIVTFFLLFKRYKLPLTLLTLLLLTTDVALFNFSRSILFETAIIFFIYTGIIFVSHVQYAKPLQAVTIVTIFALIATFTIKKSAILYCVPSILACCGLVIFNSKRNKGNFLYLIVLALMLSYLAIITRGMWLPRIHQDTISQVTTRFFLNPIPDLSIIAILLAYSCILHIAIIKPRMLYLDLYRLCLVATVIGAPLMLSFIKYNPPRYYVPIIPACLLLCVEWIHLKLWKLPIKFPLTTFHKICIVALIIPFSMFLLRSINILILEKIPYNIGQDPGISLSGLYKLFPFFSLIVIVFFFFNQKRSFATLNLLIPLLIIAHIVTGVVTQTNILMHPSFDSRDIGKTLKNQIKSSESVAGDWAPFFTANEPIRSLYMSKGINKPTPAHIKKLRPDYFLSSNSPFDPLSLNLLKSNKAIRLDKPKMLGVYMNHDIKLYRIEYLEE